ncbi:MAG TPA: ABC transporter substrate-binding protein, partial [Pyrinomonadaceae bacterium]|nr:ABC transporter substrate-binding protein [Pyrinomonadaceae bacterium]
MRAIRERSRSGRRCRNAFVGAAFYVFVVLLLGGAGARVSAQTAAGLSAQEQRGKLIYLKGTTASGQDEIVAVLSGNNIEVPASTFNCANCHGLKGEGTKEGGLQPPPIDWPTLTAAHTSALTGKARAPYSEATLKRAISAGLDSSGNRLHPGMPQYRMTAAQMADLIAYLHKLGRESDVDPGLSEAALKVGAALPLTGPLAQVGEDVRAAVKAYLAEVNGQGGIYGRRFELVTADSHGDAVGTLAATRQLVEQDRVFALLASFEPRDSEATNNYLKQAEVPLIGPVTLSPRVTIPPNPYVFYLLPTFRDQARALVDFLVQKSKPAEPASTPPTTTTPATPATGTTATPKRTPRIAVLSSDSAFDADAAAGALMQARMYGLDVVAEERYAGGQFAAARVVAALQRVSPDYIFFFGPAGDITAFARAMEQTKLPAALLTTTTMLGREAFNLPAPVAARTYLAFPATLPAQANFAEFAGIMQKAGVQLRSTAFQTV